MRCKREFTFNKVKEKFHLQKPNWHSYQVPNFCNYEMKLFTKTGLYQKVNIALIDSKRKKNGLERNNQVLIQHMKQPLRIARRKPILDYSSSWSRGRNQGNETIHFSGMHGACMFDGCDSDIAGQYANAKIIQIGWVLTQRLCVLRNGCPSAILCVKVPLVEKFLMPFFFTWHDLKYLLCSAIYFKVE